MINFKDYIQPLLVGDELKETLAVYPKYDETIRKASASDRLLALSALNELYIPVDMSVQIYSKLYLTLIRSLEQKGSVTAVKQVYENHNSIKGLPYKGLMGGADSWCIVAPSGVGKSSAIGRAIQAICPDNLIEIKEPVYRKIIPILVVQTPFDCSLKSLLLEILRKVDEVLETRYLHNALRTHATTDVLIGMVSSVSLNHIGVLVCDEAQNVVSSKNGRNLVGCLTNLINSAGIGVVFAGTPSMLPFVESDFVLARRLLTLQFSPLAFDDTIFREVCQRAWNYQFTTDKTEITDEVVVWLYNHTGGVISCVISLIRDAQELAVLRGAGGLTIEILNLAYRTRLSLLDGYLSPQDARYGVSKQNQLSFTAEKGIRTITASLPVLTSRWRA